MKKRLPYTTFNFPITKIRYGYFSAAYFWREKIILEKENKTKKGLMQVFNNVPNATICGIDETLALLKLGTGYWKNNKKTQTLFNTYLTLKSQYTKSTQQRQWQKTTSLSTNINEIEQELDLYWVDSHKELKIHTLHDGDTSTPHKAILTIEGPVHTFAHLESLYLGILTRGTKIATNTQFVVHAANKKPILYFADRFDRWSNQCSDGYATLKAGVFGICTSAMGQWSQVEALGTMPHALIALYEGDTIAATKAFTKHYPNTPIISLVDFHNDCVNTSLDVAKAFQHHPQKLWGVRLDTAQNMVDKSLQYNSNAKDLNGVCAPLVHKVRKALDNEQFHHIKIIVSGGFTPDKIHEFENNHVPVDAYGIGSYFLSGTYDHTADIIQVEGKPMSKTGRYFNPSPKLKPFSWKEIEDDKTVSHS